MRRKKLDPVSAIAKRLDFVLRQTKEPLSLQYLSVLVNREFDLVEKGLEQLKSNNLARKEQGFWLAASNTQKVVPFKKYSRRVPNAKKSRGRRLTSHDKALLRKIPTYQLEISPVQESCTVARTFLKVNAIKPPAIVIVGKNRHDRFSKFFWGTEGLWGYDFFIKAPLSFPEVHQYLAGDK